MTTSAVGAGNETGTETGTDKTQFAEWTQWTETGQAKKTVETNQVAESDWTVERRHRWSGNVTRLFTAPAADRHEVNDRVDDK